jgi:AAHS family 3-hydroxyphenylpropionic acid transporter
MRPQSAAILTGGVCLLVAAFEGIDLQAAGLSVTQIHSEFALTPSQLGYFTAASSVGVLFGALLGGRLADKIGRRPALTCALILFGVSSLATALSPIFNMIVLARFVTGIGLGGALPNLVALSSENSLANWKATTVAVMYAGFPLGGAFASAIMSWISTPSSLANIAGCDWRAIYYIGGIGPLLIVPVVHFAQPDSIEFAKRPASGGTHTWFDVVLGEGRVVNGLLLWISFFTTLLVLHLLLNWLPALLNSRGFTPSESFLIQLAFNGGGIPGSLLAGVLMDTSRPGLIVPSIYSGLVAFLGVIAAMPSDIVVALVSGAGLGAMVMATQALLYGLAPRFYPAEMRATGIGTAVCMGRIGSVVGPLLAASLIGAGRTAAQVLMAIVPLVLLGGSAAFILVGRARFHGEILSLQVR